MAYVVWLGVISCGSNHQGQPARPPVAAPCTSVRVGQVLVDGAPKSTVPALAVLEGTIDDVERARRVAAFATQQLQAQGYARAQIAVTRTQGCFVELHVAVTLGPKYEIRTIEFRTAPGDDFPVRDRLATLEDALGTVNTIGGIYVDYRLERAITRLQERYRDAGWLEAKLGTPAVTFEDKAIAIEIPVTPGPRFRVAAIRARGASTKARRAVLDEIAIEPGGWYDGAAIRTGIERARRKLDRWVELRTIVSQDRAFIELEAVLENTR
jgi:outer membrane protein assembly factor BamA